MSQRVVTREINYKTMKVAIYSPDSMQEKRSDIYLENYLKSFKGIEVIRFRTFVECQESRDDIIDAIYLHYDEINKKELKRITARHGGETQVLLITNLNNRNKILVYLQSFSSNNIIKLFTILPKRLNRPPIRRLVILEEPRKGNMEPPLTNRKLWC